VFDVPNSEIKRGRKLTVAGIALTCIVLLGIYMRPDRASMTSVMNMQKLGKLLDFSNIAHLNLQVVPPDMTPEDVPPDTTPEDEISEEEFASSMIPNSPIIYNAEQPVVFTTDTPPAEPKAVTQPVVDQEPAAKTEPAPSQSTFKAHVASKEEEFYAQQDVVADSVAASPAADTVVSAAASPLELSTSPSIVASAPAPSSSTSVSEQSASVADIKTGGELDAEEAHVQSAAVPSHPIVCAFKMYRRSDSYDPPAGCTLVSSAVPSKITKGKNAEGFVFCTTTAYDKFVATADRLQNIGFKFEKGTDKINYVSPGKDSTVHVTSNHQMMTFKAENADPRYQKFEKTNKKDVVDEIVFESMSDVSPASCNDLYDLLKVKEWDRISQKF